MMKIVLHYIYWTLVFSEGLIQLLGFDSSLLKLGLPLICGTLLLLQLMESRKNMVFPFWGWMVSFIILAILSANINGINSFSCIYFLYYTTLSYFYFVVLVNESNVLIFSRIITCLKVLILVQIPAVLVKLILVGQTEKGGVGTLSLDGGSISTIFPLFIIAILFSFFLYKRKWIYLLYIALFVFFAIVGEKRAILFFVPFILAVCFVHFLFLSKSYVSHGIMRQLLLVFGLGILSFYLITKTNRTLNPENSSWGSFDVKYLSSYVSNYVSSQGRDKYEMRRMDGLVYFFDYVVSDGGSRMWLGDGAGKLVQSRFKAQPGNMRNEYGVRYGGRMGIVWMLLQVGILGTIVYVLFISSLYLFVIQRFRSSPVYLSFLVLTVVFCVDSFIYSVVFLKLEYLKGLYFVILALIYLDQKYHTDFFTKLVRL